MEDISLAPRNRETDKGWLCIAALRLSEFWDFVDKRDLDKHALSLAVLVGTMQITRWAMTYAELSTRPGLEVAAILAAVGAPYMALQTAAIAFYFKARS